MQSTHQEVHSSVARSSASALRRQETVKPGMCGQSALLAGQVGDWTWDAVSELCETNVFSARNAAGDPTYLSFYYYHIAGSPSFHMGSLRFGDRLDVDSQVYGFSSESILTLHRIGRSTTEGRPELEPHEFFEARRPDCLYVQNFNRWICRSDKGNDNLQRSCPAKFEHAHLPRLPAEYSPRLAYDHARRNLRFANIDEAEGWIPVGEYEHEYAVDPTRDVNGVGLLYFAAYFGIVDRAIFGLWRRLCRPEADFLKRVVVDHQLCFVGNANMDATLSLHTTLCRSPKRPDREIFNVVIRNMASKRVLAISTVELSREAERDS